LAYSIADGDILCLLALWIGSIYFNVDIAGGKLFQTTSFIVPDSRITLTQFLYVLVLVRLFCLFGVAEFDTIDSSDDEHLVARNV